eukprot:CAMPEP_0176187676 /NCGR_PEP_ID=MMETSP0121_2-20121125/2517_1 /TAXON_ID=160619 /ORGANISM="Kryptoperidinium foliaceum, Strain CCMP 1326" /LENGTH=60 /DNA_ID=CAMNT_0017526217 /DNA_START=32 /DNA_END=210 /DNA_ORIENTATION=+
MRCRRPAPIGPAPTPPRWRAHLVSPGVLAISGRRLTRRGYYRAPGHMWRSPPHDADEGPL